MGIDDKDPRPPSPARGLFGLGPGVAWLAALVACRALTHARPGIAAALWGLLLLLSFVAWGRVVVRKLSPADDGRTAGWGLLGSIGMAVTLAVFGVLACFRLVSSATIGLWAATGPLLVGLTGSRAPGPAAIAPFTPRGRLRAAARDPSAWVFSIGLLLLVGLAVLHYAGSVMDVKFNNFDDEMAYRAFARQFLDTGTLYEPFSYRRVGAFGGQSLLQAMVLAFSDRDRLHILDNGICVLLVFGLIAGYRSGTRWTKQAAVLVAGLLWFTLPYKPHNLGSAFSGVVFFLALFRLCDDPAFEEQPSGAILAGLLAAAVCTLRQNYLSAAVAFVAFVYLGLVWFPGTKRRADWGKQGLVAALAMLGFLVPWLILSTIAARTPLYPIVQGNMRPDFGIIGKVSWAEELRWALENLVFFKPIDTIALFFVAAAVLPFVRRNRALHAFMFANACGFALMMHFFQTFNDAGSIARYYLGFSVAFCFASALRSVGLADWRLRNWRALLAAAIVMAAVAIQIIKAKDTVLTLTDKRLTALRDLVTQRGAPPPTPREDLYARIQAAVPPGQPMLVMLDHTYLFDGRRNVVFNYDHPGAVGPRGGPPCFQGPEAFAQYLHTLGIRYIAYQLGPSSPEYNPGYWVHKDAVQVIINGRGYFYKIQARFELDFFGVLESLAKTRRTVFREDEIRVLDVETPAP